MTSNSEETKTGAITADIAILISDYLEIPDMENWAEAISMQEQFRRKILKAKHMHKSLEGLSFLNARMIETLAATDFRLTFRTMHRLSKQAEPRPNLDEDNLFESEDTSLPKLYYVFAVPVERGVFLRYRFTSKGQFQGRYRRPIYDLFQPLTEEMARTFAEGDRFFLYSVRINFFSSNEHANLLRNLMALIPAEKFLFVYCFMDNYESPLETLIRHCRLYQLQVTAAAGQMYRNLEIHVFRTNSSTSN